MPSVSLPVFDTTIVPPGLLVSMPPPELAMPVEPEFDTVIVPELDRVPPELRVMPVPCEFDKTRLTPLGMVRVSPEETVMPLVIVHESAPSHVPPNVEAHVEPSTVPPTAYTVCVEASRISTAIDKMTNSF